MNRREGRKDRRDKGRQEKGWLKVRLIGVKKKKKKKKSTNPEICRCLL